MAWQSQSVLVNEPCVNLVELRPIVAEDRSVEVWDYGDCGDSWVVAPSYPGFPGNGWSVPGVWVTARTI